MSIILVLGGARSGKSAFAERLAGRFEVTYVATWLTDPDDADMVARVAAHRRRRPESWTTVEAADVTAAVRAASGTVLVDSLTTWVGGAPDFVVDVEALIETMAEHEGEVIVVSDEVGFGVHPSSDAGRRFRDALGDVNRAVARVADEALLVVAGRVLRLDLA